MGYKSLITKQVDLAFNRMKDIATIVTLTSNTKGDYNFATDTAPNTIDNNAITIKALKKSEKPGKDALSNSIVADLLLQSKDVNSPDIYDTVLMDSVVWRIIPPYKDNGYTISMKVARSS